MAVGFVPASREGRACTLHIGTKGLPIGAVQIAESDGNHDVANWLVIVRPAVVVTLLEIAAVEEPVERIKHGRLANAAATNESGEVVEVDLKVGETAKAFDMDVRNPH